MVKNEIKVFARLKPETKRKNIVNYQIHRRPRRSVEEDYLVLNGTQKSINEYINNRPESWNFAFYKIFDNDIEQDEIFENVAQPVVQNVLNGYNATIFAYGQTGSGKTFSITGDPERYEDRGVLPRTIQYLFETIEKNPDNLYSVEIAYLEIYNENGYDLLDPKHEVVTKLEDLPRVTIQEDETGTLHLKNLSFRSVENEKDALALLFLGDTNRAISETPMNPQSSRSHCIFTIAVSVKQSVTQRLTKAKMHLVDLAGSERVYKCCISGTILTEAKHINLSLHYLEQVIVCLGQQNVSHIPYRNSLLTAVLRDSLGGNCLTTMLATLSLNISNLEETISTCRFSQRVALIKNDVNLIFERNPEDENRFLKIEVEKLKNQIAQFVKRPTNQKELTAKEKQNLDLQVDKFLKSDASVIDWENDERKVKYCLEILRENFKRGNAEKSCVTEPEKDLNYYRNLVFQRDKEISALINMLKKSRKKSPNNSIENPGSFVSCKNQSPRISIIAKKVRLRDLMVEAKSVAELIKNGKASIGDLRTRMTNDNPVEIKTLNENLQIEQSRLARNLSLLKTLKSEATDLKTDLKNAGTYSNKQIIPPIIEINAPNFESQRIHITSSQDLVPPRQKLSEQLKQKDNDADSFKIVSSSPVEKLDDNNLGISILTEENSEMENSSSSQEQRTLKLENESSQKPRSDGDSERIFFGEIFLDTARTSGTSTSRESRRPSFRAPSFLREMLQSDCNSDAGLKPSPNDGGDDLTPRDIGIGNLTKMVKNLRADLSKSETSHSDTDVFKSVTNSDKSTDASNVSRVQERFDDSFADSEELKNCESFSEIKPNRDKSDKFYEVLKEDSERLPEHSILHENIELNDAEVGIMMNDDDSFIKSLPLTGDPEIDEEIIAFYRAKISGETY